MSEDRHLTVYYDAACALCRFEMDRYAREPGADRIRFVDVNDYSFDLGSDLPREEAKGRFHTRLSSGELRSGAAALVEIWKVLPRWRPLSLTASLPGALSSLEIGYRAFSPIRPHLARVISLLGLA